MSKEKYKLARQMLCQVLKKEAKEKGLTYQQIADITGFSQPNVSKLLNGIYSPTLDNFIKLADAVGVDVILKIKK